MGAFTSTRDEELIHARKELIRIVKVTSEILRESLYSNKIPVNDVFSETEDELNKLLKQAFNQLQIDVDERNNNSKRLEMITEEINNLTREQLEIHALIGDNLKLKTYVFDKITNDFRIFLGIKEIGRKVKGGLKKFFNFKDVADAILDSGANLVPLIGSITEFKDIFSKTRKSLKDTENNNNNE